MLGADPAWIDSALQVVCDRNGHGRCLNDTDQFGQDVDNEPVDELPDPYHGRNRRRADPNGGVEHGHCRLRSAVHGRLTRTPPASTASKEMTTSCI
jgi:hypothetical protein